MRLNGLRLKNFRQFYGETPKLEMTPVGETKVVVIHGSNGAGKTALLNAFTWALYESFTRAFQLPDQLVNKRAIREAAAGEQVEAWVELDFEHGDHRYRLRRTVEVLRTSGDPGWEPRGPSRPVLQSCGRDGKWMAHPRVAASIARVLPTDLHSYFFFDGERIEQIGQVEDKDEQKRLGEATKKLLGIEVLVRAVAHLDTVRRALEGELEDVGDPKIRGVVQKKKRLEEEALEVDGCLAELQHTEGVCRIGKKVVEDRLRTLEGAQAMQQRRDQLVKEQDARKNSLQQTRQALSDFVSTRGYKIFLESPIAEFRQLIDGLRERGELPAGMKRQFVDDLLEMAQCICKRELPPDSEARRAVEAWRERTGLADVEEKAIRMGGEIGMLEQDTPVVLKIIDQMQQRNAADREELSRVETELDEIRENLKSNPKEEVSGLETRRNGIETELGRLNREQGELGARRKAIDAEISECDGDIRQHDAKQGRQEIAQRRVDVAIKSREVIREVQSLLEADFRSRLGQRIAKLFAKISVTPYVPLLADDWSLRLQESAGGHPLPVAASQGESQILSLSFISSIIDMAREELGRRSELTGPESAQYPIVMDSPFGSLDPTYRCQIAEHVPALADQVVLMVTESQWRGEVATALARRVGRQYVLTYFTPRSDVQVESIELGGAEYDLVRQSPGEFEYSMIQEVSNV